MHIPRGRRRRDLRNTWTIIYNDAIGATTTFADSITFSVRGRAPTWISTHTVCTQDSNRDHSHITLTTICRRSHGIIHVGFSYGARRCRFVIICPPDTGPTITGSRRDSSSGNITKRTATTHYRRFRRWSGRNRIASGHHGWTIRRERYRMSCVSSCLVHRFAKCRRIAVACQRSHNRCAILI